MKGKIKEIQNLQGELDSKADSLSITGSHTETTTAIDFASAQGYTITLTDDRSYTIAGLTSSNAVGILAITHDSNTPSFSGVLALNSLVNESGVYYLKFTRQADGTIIQTNQSGGASELTIEQVLTSDELLAGNTTPITLKAAPGVGIGDRPKEIMAYLDYRGAYSGNVTLEILSGSTAVGEVQILDGTSSGWYLIPITDAFEVNAALTAQIKTGDPTGSGVLSQVGVYIVYDQLTTTNLFDFATLIYEFDFLTSQSWADPNIPDGWTTPNANGTNYCEEDESGVRFICDNTVELQLRKDGALLASTDYTMVLDIVSIADGGITFNSLVTYETAGVKNYDFTTGSGAIILKRYTVTDLVIRSCKFYLR